MNTRHSARWIRKTRWPLGRSLVVWCAILFGLFGAVPRTFAAPEMSAGTTSGGTEVKTTSVPVGADQGSDAPRSAEMTLPPVPAGFSVQDLGWLQVAYHPSLAARMRPLVQEAEQVRADLTARLGRPVLHRVHVRVGRTAGEMETLAPEGSHFPRYASGVAFSELGLILLTATSRYPGERHELVEVFRHELAHIALHDALHRDRVPRWFNEGFSVHASREASSARLSTLWTATLSGNLLPFSKLTRSFPKDANTASVAYAQAADLVRFLLSRGQEHRFAALIERVAGGQEFEAALKDAYSTDMYTLEKDWREDVARRYTFWPVIFGGSLVWVGALGLLVGGYARRRKRAQKKLARWAQEEAVEDARQKWAEGVLSRPQALGQGAAHETQSGEGVRETSQEPGVAAIRTPVPSVEHEGVRHTLH